MPKKIDQTGKKPAKPKEQFFQPLRTPFTVERKRQFIQLLRHDPNLGGRKHLVCEAIGVSASTVDEHRRQDQEFGIAFEDALQGWIDEHLYTSAVSRAVEGTVKPIIGGRYRDEVVAEIREFSDTVLLALLRANRQEFKNDSRTMTMGKTGAAGVMVVPVAPLHMDEWEDLYGEAALGDSGRTP